ncbi:hypothetical protein Bbelb_365570 [Branchiostoma belcheri]|nr:hypothetical protein Bbelb_365570 [Branchiostoma belcheri]
MAENMQSNTVPKAMVVRKEFFSEGMAKPDTGTVPPTFRQAAEGDSHNISGRCEGNKDNDDENLSDTSDDATENSEFDTYAIAYICKEQTLRIKKAVKETKNKPSQKTPDNSNNDDIHLARRDTFNNNNTETPTFNANDSNMHTQARDPNPMYTQNMNPQPMYDENDVNPNPLYLQSSPGPTFKSNKSDDNPCTQTSADTHQQAYSRPATNNDDNRCLQPYAVTRYQNDNEATSMKMPGDNEDHPCIQLDAVTHHEHVEVTIESGNCGVVQPFPVQYEEDVGESANNDVLSCQNQNQPMAAAKNMNASTSPSSNDTLHAHDPNPMYAAEDMCQGDVGWNTTSEDTQASLSSQNKNQPTAASNNDVLHALDPNPMYAAADMCQGDVGWNTTSEGTQASLSSQNLPTTASNSINDANDALHTLNPNPMYVVNVQHPVAHGCTRRRVIIAVEAAVVLGLCIVAGVFLWLFLSARPPQLPAVSNTPHHIGCDNKQERISFGGSGTEPGKFQTISGVAVSADNEIFVTDKLNKRVQVFSIDGTLLRLFPTVLPGESKTMLTANALALDVAPGYLWVLVRRSTWFYNNEHVVQYNKNGQPMKKFNVSLKGYHFVMAMDVCNNKIIVGETNAIMLFDPNGSRLWKSEVRTESDISGVTSDKEGNVLLTDGHKTIQKYNPSGVKIIEFGTRGMGEGQLNYPRGICLDTSGRIIVANSYNDRVDMFTSQGEFVRTIAYMEQSWGIAMGPCGELVVTTLYKVTIFPRHMVLP